MTDELIRIYDLPSFWLETLKIQEGFCYKFKILQNKPRAVQIGAARQLQHIAMGSF